MKYIIFSICMAVTASLNSYAQPNTDGNGLYLTSQDYMLGALSYQGARIRSDIPFRQQAVKVVQGSETKDFNKNEVYGYRDKNGQDYRFFNNRAYKIVDKAHFPLYRRVETVTNGKERIRKALYYFSAQPGSELQELTILNLKKAFADNQKFHNLLDLQFRNDKDLVTYDNFRKEYKVKTIFNSAFDEGKSIVHQGK